MRYSTTSASYKYQATKDYPAMPSLPSSDPSRSDKRVFLRQLIQSYGEGIKVGALTPAQSRMWYSVQIAGDSRAFTIRSAYRLSGKLDASLLNQSLRALVRRHDTLRTIFVQRNGVPVQVVLPEWDTSVVVKTADSHAKDNSSPRIQDLLTDELQHDFELSQAPLFRLTLLHLDDTEHILLLQIHHIISDGWSTGMFFNELSQNYSALQAGECVPNIELKYQYLDFVRQTKDRNIDNQVLYWQRRFQNAPSYLDLPIDAPRTAEQTYSGKTFQFQLSPNVMRSLEAVGHSANATPFVTLLTAFKIWLAQHTGQTDVIVCTPQASRPNPDTERLIGYFVNLLPLRSNIATHLSFKELLYEIRETVFEAFEHPDVPFETLANDLRSSQHLGRTPMAQVMFAYQNYPQRHPQFADLKTRQLTVDGGVAKLDLSLYTWEDAGNLVGQFEYNSDLFEESTIRRMADQFQELLQAVTGKCDQPLENILTLTGKEREYVLLKSHGNTLEIPPVPCVHQLIEQRSQAYPDAIAVIDGNDTITYGELNRRANQLAHHLCSFNVGPEDMICLCMRRSINMIVSLLGILKAGAAYVPLHPDDPLKRLQFICSDVQPKIFLTEHSLLHNLPSIDCATVCIDTDWTQISHNPSTNPHQVAKGEHPAYMIYTSGSSGAPKGVLVEHHSLLNFVAAANDEYRITAKDRVLQFASLTFDTSAEEIYPCLSQGATLLLRNDPMLTSAEAFWKACHKLQVTVLDLPTSFWHFLVNDMTKMDVTILESLRLVIIGGEAALQHAVEVWQQMTPSNIRLLNTYGPTEATVVTTVADLSHHDSTASAPPIGRPLGNMQAYVLDHNLNLVPMGVKGELHIAGPGVAREYWNREDLTQQRFVSNPFATSAENSRLYKTGDLARFRPDGQLEFLGRIDQQVKIRGYRIETREIEETLIKHPDVDAAVVLAAESSSSDKRLIAYVVPPKGTQAPTSTALRKHVASSLPNYMVPSAFVHLTEFPLTNSGKINHHELPLPEQAIPDQSNQLETDTCPAPMSTMESTIAKIWQEVLDVEQISVYDTFFDLGGHSLMVMQVISHLKDSLGIDVKPQEFVLQTLGQLASSFEQRVDRQKLHGTTQGGGLVNTLRRLISHRPHRD